MTDPGYPAGGHPAGGRPAGGRPVGGRAGPDGFVLLEILVGLAILALAVGYALPALSGASGWLRQGWDSTAERVHARAILDRLGRDVALPPAGQESSAEGRTADGFVWRIVVTPHDILPVPGMAPVVTHAARVTVGLPGRARTVALTTLLPGPPP